MLTAFLRLMTIFALAMMPLGMAATPAAAAGASHASMNEGHCPDPEGEKTAPSGTMDCTAACGALPATLAEPIATGAPRPPLPRDLSAIKSFEETIPEIATPPPRLG